MVESMTDSSGAQIYQLDADAMMALRKHDPFDEMFEPGGVRRFPLCDDCMVIPKGPVVVLSAMIAHDQPALKVTRYLGHVLQEIIYTL